MTRSHGPPSAKPANLRRGAAPVGPAGVTPYPVLFEGAMVGMALSLDRRFKFFTTEARLLPLDGAIFDNVAAIREAVRGRMTAAVLDRSDRSGPVN